MGLPRLPEKDAYVGLPRLQEKDAYVGLPRLPEKDAYVDLEKLSSFKSGFRCRLCSNIISVHTIRK